jgi:hypothetical protein
MRCSWAALQSGLSLRYDFGMAVQIEGYIRLVAPGSKNPWQVNFAPRQGGDNSKLFIGCFPSVKDCETQIEAKVGKRLQWTLSTGADQVPLYIGRSS